MTKCAWPDLPGGLRAVIQQRVGDVTGAEYIPDGHNNDLAAILCTEAGKVFAKGLRSRHSRAWTQDKEANMSRYVYPLGPGMRAHVKDCGWDVLVFEYVEGRPAELSPGSPDLVDVAKVLLAIPQIPVPALPIPALDYRWKQYADTAELGLLAGDRLVHSNLSPGNIIVNSGARVVDWAWPLRGPAWLDMAFLVPRMIVAGHSPASAEAWLAQFPDWHQATDEAVDTFVRVFCRLWEQFRHDGRVAWRFALAAAADDWLTHRTGQRSAIEGRVRRVNRSWPGSTHEQERA